jgi:WhiB family redox-sensing transcriptional regulator
MTHSLEATARRLDDIDGPTPEELVSIEQARLLEEAVREVGTPKALAIIATHEDFPDGRPQLSLVPDMPDQLAIAAGSEDDDRWQDKAVCAQTDPEAFFPEKGGSTREAKRICLGCEVRDRCLEYALARDERFGIWGGLSERERRRLKRGIV